MNKRHDNQIAPAQSVDHYLDQAVRYLPSTAREEMRCELAMHLQLLAEEEIAKGFSSDQAIDRALCRFGHPGKLGRQLARELWQMPDYRRQSFRNALRPVLLWCGIPVAANIFVHSVPFIPYVCYRENASVAEALSLLHGTLTGGAMPLFFYLVLILPLTLGFALAAYDRKRVLQAWGVTAFLLFAGGITGALLGQAEVTPTIAQIMIPVFCGLVISLRLQKPFKWVSLSSR